MQVHKQHTWGRWFRLFLLLFFWLFFLLFLCHLFFLLLRLGFSHRLYLFLHNTKEETHLISARTNADQVITLSARKTKNITRKSQCQQKCYITCFASSPICPMNGDWWNAKLLFWIWKKVLGHAKDGEGFSKCWEISDVIRREGEGVYDRWPRGDTHI